jgi:hypothetical protein
MYLSYLYGGRGSHGFLRAGMFNDGGGRGFVHDEWLISELVNYSVR